MPRKKRMTQLASAFVAALFVGMLLGAMLAIVIPPNPPVKVKPEIIYTGDCI